MLPFLLGLCSAPFTPLAAAASASVLGAPPPPVPSPARRPAAWVGVGPGATYRPATTPTASIDIAGGVRLAARYWLGLDASVYPTRGITIDGDADGLRDVTIAARAAWSPSVGADGHTPKVAPLLGLGAGVGTHAWVDAGAPLEATYAPVVAADLGLNVRMLDEARHLAFVPLARVAMDFSTTQTVGEYAVPVVLAPVQFELLLTFRATVPGT